MEPTLATLLTRSKPNLYEGHGFSRAAQSWADEGFRPWGTPANGSWRATLRPVEGCAKAPWRVRAL